MLQTDIQMILCDVDGTLLPKGEHTLSDDVFDAIRYATSAGVKVVIASGRSHVDLENLFSPVTASIYLIAGDGGLTMKNGQIITLSSIHYSTVENMFAVTENQTDICCVLYTSAGIFGLGKHVPDSVPAQISCLSEISGDIYKVAFYQPNDFLTFKLRSFAQRSRKLKEVYQDKNWLEFVDFGTDKGVACQKIQDLSGIPLERTAAFGDNFNDFGMLRRARMTFASATAVPEIKRMCKKISYHIPNEIIKLSQERGTL